MMVRSAKGKYRESGLTELISLGQANELRSTVSRYRIERVKWYLTIGIQKGSTLFYAKAFDIKSAQQLLYIPDLNQ